MQYDLKEQLIKNGISAKHFNVRVDITPVSTTDPEVIWVEYESAVNSVDYVPNVVKIEVSGRSMAEPMANVLIESMVDTVFPDTPFHESGFNVRAVLAKRTFLEKIFLLHEEFARPQGQIRVERMSRHLYDVHKMLSTPTAKEALMDNELYNTVIEHRRTFIGLRGFDYTTLSKKTLNIIPPEAVFQAWKNDYESMQENMIFGDSASFETIIEDLKRFNQEINQI